MPASFRLTTRAALCLLLASLPAACGGQKAAAPARVVSYSPPATILPLPSDTPAPTATPRPTLAAQPGSTVPPGARSQLPKDTSAPVVQIARIEPRASEPGLLADLTPDFAVNADGFGHFQALGGPSDNDWYQTRLTPEQVQRFVSLLVDEIGVLRLAKQREADTAYNLGKDAAGNPLGPAALGVIYVRTADQEGRLVLTEADLSNPANPSIQRLVALLVALENWKNAVRAPVDPGVAQIVGDNLGWWNDLRQPWSPTTLVALGTHAPADAPRVPVADWPLKASPKDLFEGAAGSEPDFALFTGNDVGVLLSAQREAGLDPNYPMWRDPTDQQQYVIGLRVNPPGGNHVWVPTVSGGGTAATSATPGGPATAVSGSAASRPRTPTPSASATATATP
jgi:hypothetical protein